MTAAAADFPAGPAALPQRPLSPLGQGGVKHAVSVLERPALAARHDAVAPGVLGTVKAPVGRCDQPFGRFFVGGGNGAE